jgi:hypothetical protein
MDIRTTIIKKGISKSVKKGGSLHKEMGIGHKGKQKGELANRAIFTKCCTCMYRCSCDSHLLNVVFRL